MLLLFIMSRTGKNYLALAVPLAGGSGGDMIAFVLQTIAEATIGTTTITMMLCTASR